MNRTQIKQLNKRIDKLLSVKKLSIIEEIYIPVELIKKYGITYTKTLKGLIDEDLDRIIEGESQE